MRYSFVLAATLAILAAAAFPSRGEDAAPNSLLPECKTLSECKTLLECRTQRGVVLVSPEAPHNPIKVFCADELKRFDCQILFHIRNYIRYSYGRCENRDDMYGQIFGKPDCSQDKRQNIPKEVYQYFRTLDRTEYDKGCLPPNFTPPDN
jgi:hypothetical protein